MPHVSEITPIPEGYRLVHIGPPKTGTSALQGAFHHSRSALAAQGVEYAGPVRHSRHAMMAAAYAKVPEGVPADAHQRWEALSKSVRASTATRVVLSSETLAGIRESKVAPFLEALGGPVHVVMTLRPIAAVLSSRWQQSVQDELTASYADWLQFTFDRIPETSGNPGFWRRYDLAHQLRIWGPLVGESNISVVVLDPEDRGMLLGTFERLLSLTPGTLTPDPSTSNPSFPHDEVEMLRMFNRYFAADNGSRKEYLTIIREAVIRRRDVSLGAAATSSPGDRIATPRWAAQACNERIGPWVRAIQESEATVIGNLGHLLADPTTFEEFPVAPSAVGVERAGDLAYRLYRVGFEHGVREGERAVRERRRAARKLERGSPPPWRARSGAGRVAAPAARVAKVIGRTLHRLSKPDRTEPAD